MSAEDAYETIASLRDAVENQGEGNALYGEPFPNSVMELRRQQYVTGQIELVRKWLRETVRRRNKGALLDSIINVAAATNTTPEDVILDINSAFYALEMHNIPHERGTLIDPSNPNSEPYAAHSLGREAVAYFDLQTRKRSDVKALLRFWDGWEMGKRSTRSIPWCKTPNS